MVNFQTKAFAIKSMKYLEMSRIKSRHSENNKLELYLLTLLEKTRRRKITS